VEPRIGSSQVRFWSVLPGKVYPTVYLGRHLFDPVRLPPNSHVLVVIRDLRDTLISGYFSVLSTHGDIDRTLTDLRQLIAGMSLEDGLIYMLDVWLAECAKIQLSWLEAGHPLIRYEDLIRDDLAMYRQILIDQCGLDVTPERLERIILANRFEKITDGRQRGVEDRNNHYRKGVAGDWANHFTPRVTRAFKARYGGLLVETGYERDLDW
jgi:lipopolysaccharide transport system ATP-binding protein